MAFLNWIKHLWRRLQIGLLSAINRILIRMEKLMKADKIAGLGIDPSDVLENEDTVNPEASYYAVNLTPSNYVLDIGNGEMVYKIQPSLSAESVVVISGKYVRTPEVTAAQTKGDILILKKINLFNYRENRLNAQRIVQEGLKNKMDTLLGDEYQREQAMSTKDAYAHRIENHRNPELYKNILKIMEAAEKANQTTYDNAVKDDTYEKWKADFEHSVK